MNETLKNIYRDLANGLLTQKEALQKIKDIKLKEQATKQIAESLSQSVGALLAKPVWETTTVTSSGGASANTGSTLRQHIILCEITNIKAKQLETMIADASCLLLQSAPQKNIADRYSLVALTCFEIIQKILKSKPDNKVLVQVVIPNQQEHKLFAGLSGLLKTAMLENPQIVGQIILTNPEITASELTLQLQENANRLQDAIIKYEQGGRQVLRWQATQNLSQEKPLVAFKDNGVYIITGGLGGVGILFAKEILKQTSKAKIIFTGRSVLTAQKRALLDELSAPAPGSFSLNYIQLDLANLDQVKQLIASVKNKYQQLNGIIHSAGMNLDNFILKKTSAEFSQVISPKVTGTYNLDQASQGIDLDFLVLFSSVASWRGNLGQADYAAANGFMDQFAGYRNQLVAAKQRQGVTLSINWPLWQSGGMLLDQTTKEMLQQTTGMQPMQTATGMHAFYRGLESQYDQVLVMEGDLVKMHRTLVLEQTIQTDTLATTPIAVVEKAVAAKVTRTVAQVSALDVDSLFEKTQDYLRKQFSALLKLPAAKIDPKAPLENYGIDSILAMKLTSQLELTFGTLSKTLFFEYQTIRELTQYFVKSYAAQLTTIFSGTKSGQSQPSAATNSLLVTSAQTASQNQVTQITGRRFNRQRVADGGQTNANNQNGTVDAATSLRLAVSADPIAIVGLSGRYPEAVNIEDYWCNLRDGKDCIVEVPKDRWDWREYFSEDRTKEGYHYSKWGGFISGVDEFDPRFFNISPREAKSIDPQERLFLQHAWMAVEDAGYTRASLQVPREKDLAGQVGVYVGVMYGEYNVSGSLASIANRVSYVLNLHGPSMTLDTMCSSSLTAIHLACQDLKQGRTDVAIAGGVNVSIHPNKYLMLSAGQFISSDGHCQSFGEGGDGYIPGEGVGAVVLKRLSEAKQAGNHIYGVIRGSALNHGGKTNGYSVPNPQAQASAISQALLESNTDPRHVSYIEAHGTGTKLGDPIEIAALNKAFYQYDQESSASKEFGFCALGSAKSNIGHCESAAGMAGLTKVLMQMRHQQIVPSLHSTRLNPHIDFAKSPFVVNQALKAWDQPVVDGQQVPRIAGLSSFGAGGSNAHIIIEEYAVPMEISQWGIAPTPETQVIVPLSARTAEQLKQKAQDLLDFIRAAEVATEQSLKAMNLVSVAYTLQVGREAMDERLGFMVSSIEQLAEKLQAYVNGEQDIEDAYQGQVKRNKDTLSLFSTDTDLQETIDKWIAHKKLTKLLDLWVEGLELDWNKLYEEAFDESALTGAQSNRAKPQLISLPTYPFAKERYWADSLVPASGRLSSHGMTTAVLHPLLHSNTSNLFQQSYSSTFSGEEFFLADHQVSTDGRLGQKILPAVIYLEMVRAAVEKAMPITQEASILELHKLVWAQPIAAAENKQINIALFAKDKEQIDFEIYSLDKDVGNRSGEESRDQGLDIVHCQGHAVFSHQPAPARLDITHLKNQMGQGKLDAASLYASFTKMGLNYGPAHQGITALYQGENQLLAELSLPDSVENNPLGGLLSDYILHPSLMDSALQASIGLIADVVHIPNQPSLPFALDTLRIIFACTKDMLVWVRYSQANTQANEVIALDIDLCDLQGNVCVQMRGIQYQQELLAQQELLNQQETFTSVEQVLDEVADLVLTPTTGVLATEPSTPELLTIAPKKIIFSPIVNAPSITASSSQKISIAEPALSTLAQVATKKPSISLSAPMAITLEKSVALEKNSKPLAKTTITLSQATLALSLPEATPAESSAVSLYDNGNGTFSIHIATPDTNKLTRSVIEQLSGALAAVQQVPLVKVLTISGTAQSFLSGGREEFNAAVTQKLYQTIAAFPCPVIAVMQGDATGAGFLLGALCDFMICSEEGHYSYTNLQEGLYPASSEYQLFAERFGDLHANQFLYIATVSSGKQLREKGWTCPILPAHQVQDYAQQLVATLAKKPEISLHLLKQHLTRTMVPRVDALTSIEADLLTSDDEQKTQNKIISPANNIQLDMRAEKTLVIKMSTMIPVGKKTTKPADELNALVKSLASVFTQLKQSTHYHSVVLASDYSNFLANSEQLVDETTVLSLQRIIRDAQIPVIAVLDKNAKGLAWLVGLLCDACVYSDQGHYGFGQSMVRNTELAKTAAMMFAYHFGHYLGKEILLTGHAYSGSELQQRVGILNVAAQADVLAKALLIAESWSGLPRAKIVSWKKEIALSLQGKIKQLPAWLGANEKNIVSPVSVKNTPVAIALTSSVITATAHPEGILVVNMEDRQAKNMFSDEFISGMNEVFAHIENTPDYKVIVLTGYDNYFASGGTKENLLAIQDGSVKFTDVKIYELPLKCKLPVIAAMQGHGIGAGWSMGMFADFIFFSEESKYVSPYMNYGFTPGAGSTFIFADKIGYDLARETLLTGQEYSGSELKTKGLLLPVLARKQVVASAMTLAQQIAQNSRNQLIAVKHLLTQHLYQPLEETYQLEVTMHEKTFVGQSETLAKIQDNFLHTSDSLTDIGSHTATNQHLNEKINGNAKINPSVTVNPAEKSAQAVTASQSATHLSNTKTWGGENLATITATLRKFLAQELHLQEEEIEANKQFIDLGLDSITGVTLIRKINEKYKTTIEATKVYSYPTLGELSRYVQEEADTQGALLNAVDIKPSAMVATANLPRAVAKPIAAPAATEVIDVLLKVTSVLKKLLAQELHLQENEIGENAQFVDLGLDSITGVTWIRKINEKYQTAIETTKVYSYSTLAQLSRYVMEEAEKSGALTKPVVSEETIATALPDSQNKISSQNKSFTPYALKQLSSWRNQLASRIVAGKSSTYQIQPIAVIGMAGQFPQAKNLDEFWENIAQGKNCISQVSAKRWDVDSYYNQGPAVPGKTNCKWLGGLEEYDLFDPLFFNISPVEAESMDPQQRVFLQACWNTIENAGYNAQALSGSKCGVFVGCANGDYRLVARELQLSAQGFTGDATSILAARISYFLNLQGPCLSIDTACSSSLVAIANACDSLIAGNSDLALAGGVYVMAGPEMHIKTSQTGMLSTDGRCFSFDQRANGFVPGEGVGVVMLKRLADAEKDQDIIQGVIQGWGVNQDGKTNGITAPNPESQTRLQQDVYDKYQIDPGNIQLIEAHGTGTKLGDPIEVDGLKASFKKYTQKKDYCALGSVKSNIGHCLTAAGISGFIKVILALKHKQLPPTINFDKLNEHVGLKDSPFYINTELQEWQLKGAAKRQAAISSFGFSGTNAHLVIAEHLPENSLSSLSAAPVVAQQTKFIIPLSARTAEQLGQRVRDLVAFIHQQKNAVDITELAYTLQVGREAMEERLGFMVGNVEQLQEKLQAYVAREESGDQRDIEDLYQGQVKRNREGMSIISQDDDMKETIVEKWIARQQLFKLLDLWVKGLDLDWNKLYCDIKPQRINLPTYPFAKDRYWIEKVDAAPAVKTGIAASTLHPLLHKNTADLSQQGFSSAFSGIAAQQADKAGQRKPKLQRICLPAYPFAKDRCWVEVPLTQGAGLVLKPDSKLKIVKNFESIEDIINKIDSDSIETNQAVKLIKSLA
ncbi:MAG: SDR family NAD(P)-dependent oxidoreductase [Pseudomonadota bacterium]